jgi:azurin
MGTKPLKGRSVPVLEVSQESRLVHWLWHKDSNKTDPVEYQAEKSKLPGDGFYQSFVYSDTQQPATIGINHKSLEVYLNGILEFRQSSLWSGDQQINVELQPGLNCIEISFLPSRKKTKFMPPVYLYNLLGESLSNVNYLTSVSQLRKARNEYNQQLAKEGNIVRIQTAPELKFSPVKLEVQAGSEVKLIFSNPDVMLHNWLLVKPGSAQEVGELADQMASQPDGFTRGYIPDSDKILVASKLLSPKEVQEITFQAPEKPGDYPYLCTFPGHWRMMQGVLTVKAAP